MRAALALINGSSVTLVLNGNIPDISSVSLCFKEIELTNVILVADKAFYSEKNMKALEDGGVQYIVPLRRSNSAVNYNPLLQADFKKNNEFFIYQKRQLEAGPVNISPPG
ncbi:hypothetical protein FACS1894126_5630 [Alphaproteobacteria bacterium]|nr:hypothetical protein FACS1894126_5630 [Alphaproteobacteria bacterium]